MPASNRASQESKKFSYPNELLIWACPENLVGISQVKAEKLMLFRFGFGSVRVRFGFRVIIKKTSALALAWLRFVNNSILFVYFIFD